MQLTMFEYLTLVFKRARVHLRKPPELMLPPNLCHSSFTAKMVPTWEVYDWLRDNCPEYKYESTYSYCILEFPSQEDMVAFKLSFDCPTIPCWRIPLETSDYIFAILEVMLVASILLNVFSLVTKIVKVFT